MAVIIGLGGVQEAEVDTRQSKQNLSHFAYFCLPIIFICFF